MPAVAVLLAYLIGSIPTGYWLVKALKGIDVRTVGSGNIGATNTIRAAGKGIGAAVFVIDLLKGAAAVWLITPVVLGNADGAERLLCGLAAVVGHCFPLFLGFRGGKGVATSIGVLLAASPVATFIFILTWGLCAAIFRYVSLASISAALTIPFFLLFGGRPGLEIAAGSLLALLITVRHRANLERLMRGQEPKIGARKESLH